MKQLKTRTNLRFIRSVLWGTMFLIMPLMVMAQQVTIKGVVKDGASGEVLPGVNVIVQGSPTIGTVSSADGAFTITVPSANSVLAFSFIGYKTENVQLNGQANISVALTLAVEKLQEIVVTGYQSQKKADLTGAITVVDVADIKNMPNSNAIQALQGRVPGLAISTDGSPSGSNVGITIRGTAAINGSVDPLFIIDGVPTTGGTMYQLNPNDIESIQVLKDASAASIYGSRASGGVFVVTTKKAKKGETQITVNARTSYSYYSTKMSVLDAQQYGQAMWQASANDGAPLSHKLSYTFDWTNVNVTPVLNKINLPQYLDTTAVVAGGAANTMKIANTNWFKEISQVAISQNYDFTLSHGGDKGNSMFSVGYTDNNGIIKTTEFQRLVARLNTDYKLFNDKVLIGENLTMATTNEVKDQGALNLALQALPIVPVHTLDGIGWGGPFGGMNDRDNPVRVLEMNQQNKYYTLRLFGNVFADVEPVKNLHIKSSVGVNYLNEYNRFMQLAYRAGFLNNSNNYVTDYQGHSINLTWTNTANYKYEFDKSVFDAVVGSELNTENDVNFTAKNSGYLSTDPNYMYLDAGTGSATVGGGATEIRLMSYFGKANYVYNEKYLGSITLRYDGSSKFGANNRFGTFPAFNLGWRLSKENFIKDNFKFISDLKLRFGWGKTGNQSNINATANQTLYSTAYVGGDPTWGAPNSTAYAISGQKGGTLPSGYIITQQANNDLKWEATTQTNYGLDFGLLDQKIYGSVDVYDKKTTGMLVNTPWLAAIGEGGSEWMNGATMDNKGVEILLGYRGKIGSDFSYDFAGNIATNRNKITDLPFSVVNNYGGNGTTDNILGHPWGSGYGYVADGLFKTADEVANSPIQQGKGLGRIRYKDLNGDGVIDSKDQTWILNPVPDFTYGFNINCAYKGFDLTMFFQGVGHVDVNVHDVKDQTDFWAVAETGSNKGTRLLGAWTPSNPNSTIPALSLNNLNDEGRFSTYYVENGAYLKLRNIQVGYTIPKAITEKVRINNLKVYVSGQNILTIKSKNFTGVDPESAGYGYPIPTMYTAGLKLTF